MSDSPKRGEVYWGNLSPARGREPAKIRPVLVISANDFNSGPLDLVIIAPLTTKNKLSSIHVEITPIHSTLDRISYVQCENVRSVSKSRLGEYLGAVENEVLEEVSDILFDLLEM